MKMNAFGRGLGQATLPPSLPGLPVDPWSLYSAKEMADNCAFYQRQLSTLLGGYYESLQELKNPNLSQWEREDWNSFLSYYKYSINHVRPYADYYCYYLAHPEEQSGTLVQPGIFMPEPPPVPTPAPPRAPVPTPAAPPRPPAPAPVPTVVPQVPQAAQPQPLPTQWTRSTRLNLPAEETPTFGLGGRLPARPLWAGWW